VTGAERAIRWSTVAAVTAVAIVAGWVSYDHALTVVRAHGETGIVARLYPGTIDGLIYSASMVLLDAARRSLPAPPLARWLLASGITATLLANVASGIAYGLTGALVAAWPALALVGSYELLMTIIRSGAGRQEAEQPAAAEVTEAEQVLAQVAADAESAARAALAASFAAGNPLSQRQVMTRFGLTRATERKVREAVTVASNGHGTPAPVPAGPLPAVTRPDPPRDVPREP
jgi:hypothetical protein